MVPRAALLTLILAASPLAAQTQPDLSTPEAAVKSFVQAVNALDLRGASCVVGGKIDADLRAWQEDARKAGGTFQLAVISVAPAVKGDDATATVTFEVKSNGRQKRLEEKVSLRKSGAEWQLVPATEAAVKSYFQAQQEDPPMLPFFAAAYAFPKTLLTARDAGRDRVCQENGEQLAKAVLTFIQDADDQFAFKADAWKAAVLPYTKGEYVFHCASDYGETVSYSFNAQLQGKPLAAVKKPELTVLVYEGKKGVLAFHHNGHATVAFADGKVRSVTPAQARTLRWAP